MNMKNDFQEVLLNREDLKEIVRRIGRDIKERYCGKEITLVVPLTGAMVFAADLMRELYPVCDVRLICMQISSYGENACSSGEIKVLLDAPIEKVAGKKIIIVEDIVDTGATLNWLVNHLLEKGAEEVETCVLVDKAAARKIPVVLDYVGRQIPNEFVVGYGLDYAGKYRHVPKIAILKKEVYEK